MTATNKNSGNGKPKSVEEGFTASAHTQIVFEKDFAFHAPELTHPQVHC